MTSRIDGGPAFPQPVEIIGRGMSLRDYFAAAALQSILTFPGDRGMSAEIAYKWADAMLAEREK